MSRARPAVSILLPVRNAGATLERSLASCMNQTFTDFELLIANDGSTDRAAEILRDFSATDSRVRVLDVDPPGGLVPSLLLLCANARAPLLARMDADDVSHPERLAVQTRLMDERPDLAACGCGVRIEGTADSASAKPREGFRRYEAWINGLTEPDAIARERFIESPMVHPTAMIRAEALAAVGGYRDTPWAEDYDLWLRMIERGMKLAKAPRILMIWQDGPERLTRTDPRYSESQFLEAKAHYLSRLDLIHERGVMISGAGPNGKRLAKALQARGVRLHGFLDVHPRRSGSRILDAPVIAAGEAPGASAEAPVQLSAVGRAGRRENVRRLLSGKGYREGKDFFCVC